VVSEDHLLAPSAKR